MDLSWVGLNALGKLWHPWRSPSPITGFDALGALWSHVSPCGKTHENPIGFEFLWFPLSVHRFPQDFGPHQTMDSMDPEIEKPPWHGVDV